MLFTIRTTYTTNIINNKFNFVLIWKAFDKLIIFCKICFVSSPLNIIKLIITISSVYILPTNLGSFCKIFPKTSFSKINNMPKYNHHIIKFHAAPCHKPVSNHTTKIFLIHFKVLTLLPPNGMYM